MTYNLTGIVDNGTTLIGFVPGVINTLMLGWLGFVLLIGISVVIFMAFISSTNDVRKSISATAFIAFILTIFLKAVNLIGNNLVLYGILVVCAVSIAATWRNEYP